MLKAQYNSKQQATSNKQQHRTNEYLKLDLLVVYLYCARTKPVAEKLWEHIKVIFSQNKKKAPLWKSKKGENKLDADGDLVHSLELVVGELEQQTALAHTAVANDDVFEEELV